MTQASSLIACLEPDAPPLPKAADPVQWASGRILRIIGGALLIASFSTFLLRRWELHSDLFRYGVLLLHTVLLVAAALFCSFGIRENRGARTLLALTLAAVPFNVAVLAGFVYSRHVWDDASVVKPSSFLWVASSETELFAILGTALPVLTVASWFALRTLVRSKSQVLLVVFAAANGLLLIPMRAPLFTAISCIVAVAVISGIERWRFADVEVLRTPEGILVRVLMLAPVALLLTRCAFLYPDASLVTGALAMSVGVWCAAASRCRSAQLGHQGLVVVSALGLLLGWLCIWTDIAWLPGFAEHFRLAALVLPWALGFQLLALVSRSTRSKMHLFSMFAVVVATVPNLLLYPSTTMELFGIGSGLVWLLLGVMVRSKLTVAAGCIAIVSGLAYQLVDMVHVELFSHWMFLSASGMGLILIASWIERNQLRLRRRLLGVLDLAQRWDF